MSRVLAELIDEPLTVVNSMIESLEQLCGYTSEDIRLVDEVSKAVKEKTKHFGLDPSDTTPRELYHAMLNQFGVDCEQFNSVIGHSQNTTASKRVSGVLKIVASFYSSKEVWCLKQSSAKALLRAYPPKAVMKKLGYRSVESMLKHENVVTIFAALPVVMGKRWQTSFWHSYSKLTPLDFETRKIELISPSLRKWQSIIDSAKQSIASVPQLGAVVIWRTPSVERTNSLALVVLATKAVETVYFQSLVAKSQQSQAAFGSRVSSIWNNDLPHIALLAGQSLQWRTVFNHLAHLPKDWHPESFEPYILPEHLQYLSVSEIVSRLHPSFHHWGDSHYLITGQPKDQLSLNVYDTAVNHANNSGYAQRTLRAGRQAFWDELIGRYLRHPSVFNRLAASLEASMSPQSVIRVEANEYLAPALKTQGAGA